MRRRRRQTIPCQPRDLSCSFNFGFVRWNRNHLRALRCMQWLAQIAGGKQMIVQIAAAEEQDVDVAGELAMLKAVVEKM